jgi:hypothetical protein
MNGSGKKENAHLFMEMTIFLYTWILPEWFEIGQVKTP